MDQSYISSSAEADIETLEALEEKVRWLASWTIHNANHLRESRDGLKVGGHQASCASLSAIMTALYFHVLRSDDRVAVKPHASPVFHAIQYLLGHQTREKLESFRAYGGAQSYPSRTKDNDTVDFSTGSVGLGAAVTNFAALTQDYLRLKDIIPSSKPPGRMIALVGDAELDEGNVYEALMDTWKHDIRNVWWVIDYNRQSLDGVVNEQLFRIIGRFFRAVGWNVITLKYGSKQMAAFAKPGGQALKRWINTCPNDVYSALAFQGAAAWRAQIKGDMPHDQDLHSLIDSYDDAGLNALMTNLGGHDIPALLHTFSTVPDDRPTCFIAYTIKGWGLPLMGHKDNHAGLMNPQQMAAFQKQLGVPEGQEWEPFSGMKVPADRVQSFLNRLPQKQHRLHEANKISIPDTLTYGATAKSSTQEVFGKLLNEIAKAGGPLADRIVTTSPDVSVSTNLGPWINQRGLFARESRPDEFRERNLPSAQKWIRSPQGQHIELGIAENDLFLNLAALGLSESLFGARLFPIGTLYDPFIARGLDALNYACYQDSRFIVVATPSGITLAPEGGAHQSISTPMIGMGQPGLTSYEPAYGDELAVILRHAFVHLQDEEKGGSLYLRLSTRPIEQPDRKMTPDLARQIIKGGYWVVPPKKGAKMAIVYMGAVAPQALEAFEALREDNPDAGLMAITSADKLYSDWQTIERARLAGTDSGEMAHVEDLFAPLASDARFTSVIDGHPAAVAWMGAVRGHSVAPLGVESFGQTGDLIDLYRHYGIDADHIRRAAERKPKS
ncbi:MAG: transketolase [Rhodospirillales bacterium]|jgi:pyruvate dehydrogenase E1 component|uniref:transketolase n=1 Tax=Hwanghaeella sp. 1Z406 TaxID=3402811 RepID=UPI000C98C34A|nr:transketolase [Rhodospirillales bacterium]|tara:strand:- start:95 stop:2443 length:2349 start_codon:yes stop_codon:yes gene_type:complete